MDGWFLFFLMYTGVYSIVFITIHVITTIGSKRVWTGWDTAVLAWGVVYAFTALYYGYLGSMIARWLSIQQPEAGYLSLFTMIGVPGLITMLLVQPAWKSDRVALFVSAGTAVSFLISISIEQIGLVFLAPLAWNAAYAIGCALEIDKRELVPTPNVCRHCGYSLIGLSSIPPCPECGNDRTDVVGPPASIEWAD